MKIYRVVTERDGETTKKPGESTTEIVRSDYRYAANSMQQVWDAIDWMKNDTETTLVAILEEHPAITILEEVK